MELLSTFPECNIAISTRADGPIESARTIESLFAKENITGVHSIVLPDHEHATTCVNITRDIAIGTIKADGLITHETNIALCHRFADCVPIILLDRRRRSVAALHGGWKGLSLGIVAEGLLSLQLQGHSDLNDIWIWIGPCIQPKSYTSTVPPQQLAFSKWTPFITKEEHKYLIDLPGFITAECKRLGVDERHIISDGRDTFAEDEIFYSYFRSKVNKDSASNQRFMVACWLS